MSEEFKGFSEAARLYAKYSAVEDAIGEGYVLTAQLPGTCRIWLLAFKVFRISN